MRDKLRSLLGPHPVPLPSGGAGEHRRGLWSHVSASITWRGSHTWGDTGYWISSAANYVVGSVVSFFLNKQLHLPQPGKGRESGPPICPEHRRVLGPGLWHRQAGGRSGCWPAPAGASRSRGTCPCWRAPASLSFSTTLDSGSLPSAAAETWMFDRSGRPPVARLMCLAELLPLPSPPFPPHCPGPVLSRRGPHSAV